MSQISLVAETGRPTGSGAANRLRAAGKVPGVVYGHGSTPVAIAVDHRELRHALSGPAGVNEDGRTKSSRGHHLAFSVDDAAAAAGELESAGVRFVSKPKTRPDGAIQTFILDPDGHVIELCSMPE